MHRPIINITTRARSNIIPIPLRLPHQPKMLLLIQYIMFRARNHTRILYSLYCLSHHHARIHRIGTESLPVSASFRCSAQRTGNRAELDVDALGVEFFAHCETTEVREGAVKGCGYVDAGGKGGVVVALSLFSCVFCLSWRDAYWIVCPKVHLGGRDLGIQVSGLSLFRRHRSLASNWSGQSSSTFTAYRIGSPGTRRQINLLSKSKLAHEFSRLLISFCPVAFAVAPRRGIIWWWVCFIILFLRLDRYGANRVWVIVELTCPATSTEELNNVVHQNARIIVSIHKIWQSKRKTLSRCVSRPRKD